MGNFRRDDRSRNRRDFARSSFRDHDRSRQMFSAICSECGKECQVPFKPTSNKPIFCSECFEKKGGGSKPRRFEDRNDRRPQNNQQFESINNKLDQILAILAPAPSPVAPPQTETEKEIVIQPEKPAVTAEKKTTKKSSKTAPAPEE